MNLNIIGNGFDLYHGMPSSYYYFGCYLVKKEPEFYVEMGNMYNIEYGINFKTYPDLEYDFVVKDMFWTDFEANLGDIDENFIIDKYNYDLNLEYDDIYDIPMDDDKCADLLKEEFIHWVTDTLDKAENYEMIRKYVKQNSKPYELGFTNNDRYVVFNYTHTLQQIYNISNDIIYYIHGECTGSEDDELIIGHGNDRRIEEIQNMINLYDNKEITQENNTRGNEYRGLLKYIEKLRKDVHFCMNMAQYFYSSFGNVPDNINVYGVSLGEVDIPYFQQIRKMWPNATWTFAYYSNSDIDKINYVACNRLNLSKHQYKLFKFSNNDFKTIKEEIIKLQNIEEFSCI